MQIKGNTAGIQGGEHHFTLIKEKYCFFLLMAENVCSGDYKNKAKGLYGRY